MLVFDDVMKPGITHGQYKPSLCRTADRKGRLRQYSVLLMDCAKLPWNIHEIVRGLDEGGYDYTQLMQEFCIVPPEKIGADLPYEWNSLEHFEPNHTRLIHYTDVPQQPWVCFDNPHGKLWYQTLREAVAEGFISVDEVFDEIRRGNVHPQLGREIGLRVPWYRQLRPFVPPYKRL
jgi:hypothetical protein